MSALELADTPLGSQRACARVAVVDDDPSVRELVMVILEERGYRVDSYEGIRDAETELAQEPPDLLLTDVELPDGCGLDLVSRLRTAFGRRVPVIVLSGRRDEKDYARGFAAGAVDYLGKPFSRAELLARCARHLGTASGAADGGTPLDGIPLRGGLAFGRYKIERLLGRGGSGAVYRALDHGDTGRVVALKVLAALADDEARLRFVRETYALSCVDTPHVVRVLDVGATAGRSYYTMELVEGETLRERIHGGGPLVQSDARAVMRGLAEALAALERANVVHRDIKPDNVILRGCDIAAPVLVDFGLAKRPFDRGVTDMGAIVGTPGYIAPEVIRGRDPDRRSDLFSLGLTIRAALAGEEIFPTLEGNDLLLAIAHGPIPPPPVTLDPVFATILASLVETDPDRRPPSASELLRWLGGIG